MTRDPKAPEPLVSSAEDAELRGLLEAGRSELPREEQLSALASKLGPLLGPGGSGGGGVGGAVAKKGAGAALAKVLGGATLAVVLGSAAVHTLRSRAANESPVTAQATSAVVAAAPAVSATAVDETPLPPPAPIAPRRPVPSARASASAARAAAPLIADDPDAEVKLLQGAQGSLASDPAQTLALCAEHARRFPNGLMAQEREVLAIEALAQTGRMDEARARADRFAVAYPSSTHLRRIRAVVGDAP